MYFLVHSTEINQIGTVYSGENLNIHLYQKMSTIEKNGNNFMFQSNEPGYTIGLHLME